MLSIQRRLLQLEGERDSVGGKVCLQATQHVSVTVQREL